MHHNMCMPTHRHRDTQTDRQMHVRTHAYTHTLLLTRNMGNRRVKKEVESGDRD